MPFETEIVAPAVFASAEDADFLLDKIRELAWPVIVVRFDAVSPIEAQERIDSINEECRSKGLPEFPPVRYIFTKEDQLAWQL